MQLTVETNKWMQKTTQNSVGHKKPLHIGDHFWAIWHSCSVKESCLHTMLLTASGEDEECGTVSAFGLFNRTRPQHLSSCAARACVRRVYILHSSECCNLYDVSYTNPSSADQTLPRWYILYSQELGPGVHPGPLSVKGVISACVLDTRVNSPNLKFFTQGKKRFA